MSNVIVLVQNFEGSIVNHICMCHNHYTEGKTACCSYLALVAALASEADQVFIPEDPVPNNWVEKLCKRLQQVCMLHWVALAVILITHKVDINKYLVSSCYIFSSLLLLPASYCIVILFVLFVCCQYVPYRFNSPT